MPGWSIKLNGTYLSGGDDTDVLYGPECSGNLPNVVGCLNNPPKGLGLPPRRVEDTTYAQRDGVKHFNDWYEPRILTIESVDICNDNCGCSTNGNARVKASQLLEAWGRDDTDTELVIYTDCHGQAVTGDPYLGTAVVRKNLVRNPSFENGLIFGWTMGVPTAGATTVTVRTDGGFSESNYARLTRNATGLWIAGFNYDDGQAGLLPVVVGLPYTASMYFRTNQGGGINMDANIQWWNADLGLIGTDTGATVSIGAGWARIDVTAVAPANAEYAVLNFDVDTVLASGNYIDIDAALFEQTDDLLAYFDGDSPDGDDPVVGGFKVTNVWGGATQNSVSYQLAQPYEENIDRSLYGPYGVVGRPRVADLVWVGQGSSCAVATLRFDGVDERVYVLDECGTPGLTRSSDVTPGTEELSVCFPICFSGAGMCFTEPNVSTSVPPVVIFIRGTQAVSPVITLYPGLTNPRLENITNGQWIQFAAPVADNPVVIDTGEGTATQNGEDVTYLLRGSLFFRWAPGTYELRVISQSTFDDGYAQVAWRDTVVMI